jgi:hypothetical protein
VKVLVACEESGRVRDAFQARGHDAVSLDILPTSSPGPHRQERLTPEVLTEGWDLVVAFPPCTHLSSIGAQYWPRWREEGKQQAAFEFVKSIWDAPVERVAIENPVGWMNTNWQKPTQIINPWEFGDLYTKKTCLWLKGLTPLVPTVTVKGTDVVPWVTDQHSRKRDDGSREWVRHGGIRRTDSVTRSKTFPGIARAMADAWG